ncbi:MAG: hypothetical protein ACLP50_22230 [Solirubrobacteraceae bacterium]
MALARLVTVTGLALAAAWAYGLGSAEAATPVTATPAQVASQLFVAGDVARLSVVPSGTESLLLEKVLQELYAQNPALSSSDAVSDIQGLEGVMSSPGAPSAATLTVMSGNQQILTILDALEASDPPGPVGLAVTAVARDALTEASAVLDAQGTYFDASADNLSTLSAAGFSPASVLEATVTLAAANSSFAQARDALWASVSHEHVLDSTEQLLGENPALQNAPVSALVATLSDGSFSSDETTLMSMINADETQIDDQTCTPDGPPVAPGSGQQPTCGAGALHDAELVAQACPGGTSSSDATCQAAISSVSGDPQQEANTISAEEAAATAAAGLLGYASAQLQIAEQAAAQTAAQVAAGEDAYLAAQSTNGELKIFEDVGSLIVTLSVSEIDPVWAIDGLFAVINDGVALGQNAPDPNQLILTGIQNISQQISDFEQYTQTAFTTISDQLGALSGQVAQETYALSTQLTNAQDQITQLSAAITNLQNSVDELQSEVQSLFAANANNDLMSITTDTLGYATVNDTPLPLDTFSTATGDLLQDATGTALSQTVLTPPGPFDAGDASTQLNIASSDPLNTNINYFNYFPELVSDSPTGPFTAAPLAPGCAAAASGSLCLPNPAFWASASRAFAQLLLENPQYVTQARLTQLQSLIHEGTTVQTALAAISANDAGSDAGATGSHLLDGLLAYYKYWATGGHPAGALPSLQQAIENEEAAYLSSQQVPAEGVSFAGVFPWDGVEQPPDYAGLLAEPTFQNVPLCDQTLGAGDSDTTLAKLNQTILQYVPSDLLNAARLGVGNISVCWNAVWTSADPGADNPGDLDVQLIFFADVPTIEGNGNPGVQRYEIAFLNADQSAIDVTNGDGVSDAIATAALGWMGAGGTDFSTLLTPLANAIPPSNLTTAAAYDDPLTAQILQSLQQGIYKDILAGGSALTTGTSPATDVLAAAQRLDGASALLDDYVRLGFSQALASDDNLQELINGAESDVFAYPGLNLFGTKTLDGVPAQLISYYQQAQAAPGLVEDPVEGFDSFGKAVTARVQALTAALASYVQTGRASGQAASGGGALAESSPVVASTLVRLQLSLDVLADETSGALPVPGSSTTTTDTTTTGITATGTTTTDATTTDATTTGTTTTDTTTTGTTTPAVATPAVATPAGPTSPATGGSGTVHSSTTAPLVTLTLRCTGRTCRDQITALVTERLRGGRVVAVGSAGRPPRGESNRTVVVAFATFTLAPSRSRLFTLTLNATGRMLLSRSGRLPVTITVVQRQGHGRARTVETLRRTVTPAADQQRLPRS